MMYHEKFVTALKVDGQFLRDENGVVKIPFDSAYSLYLKNLESRTAVVGVSIDGKDVLDGNRLVVESNSSMDLLGFMDGQRVRNKFKFVELTKEVEKDLGYDPSDSLVRIEVWYKKIQPQFVNTYVYTYYNPIYPYRYDGITYGNLTSSGDYTIKDATFIDCSNTKDISSINFSNTNDVGVTVRGNDCRQNFGSTYVGELETESHVFVLRLSGYKEDKKVSVVTNTKDKKYCPNCGKANYYGNKFCTNCGKFIVGL